MARPFLIWQQICVEIVKNMREFELGAIQTEFAELIWEKEPVSSGELVKLCNEKFGWKKSTTYTVLKTLSEKGLFQNENGTVTSLLSKEEFYAARSGQVVEELFQGSLPAFVASFVSKRKLSETEIDELVKIIREGK